MNVEYIVRACLCLSSIGVLLLFFSCCFEKYVCLLFVFCVCAYPVCYSFYSLYQRSAFVLLPRESFFTLCDIGRRAKPPTPAPPMRSAG